MFLGSVLIAPASEALLLGSACYPDSFRLLVPLPLAVGVTFSFTPRATHCLCHSVLAGRWNDAVLLLNDTVRQIDAPRVQLRSDLVTYQSRRAVVLNTTASLISRFVTSDWDSGCTIAIMPLSGLTYAGSGLLGDAINAHGRWQLAEQYYTRLMDNVTGSWVAVSGMYIVPPAV